MFIHNFSYHMTHLIIYADAIIDCWGLVTLDEFAEKVHDGWVATTIEAGAQGSAHDVGQWTFAGPESWLTPETLLGEVRDEIDRLNHRPDSTARCLELAVGCG